MLPSKSCKTINANFLLKNFGLTFFDRFKTGTYLVNWFGRGPADRTLPNLQVRPILMPMLIHWSFTNHFWDLKKWIFGKLTTLIMCTPPKDHFSHKKWKGSRCIMSESRNIQVEAMLCPLIYNGRKLPKKSHFYYSITLITVVLRFKRFYMFS